MMVMVAGCCDVDTIEVDSVTTGGGKNEQVWRVDVRRYEPRLKIESLGVGIEIERVSAPNRTESPRLGEETRNGVVRDLESWSRDRDREGECPEPHGIASTRGPYD
ncbi:hypothetical protein DVH24_038012 [Malus domestica]|uniref:Uncharacterized protein n=1 Tax=Malus domestica TaxID=3750 RepID=A0A498K8I6_MALDO|nr:hypothetical protein DVH24_038012 [Malus domestica]